MPEIEENFESAKPYHEKETKERLD